jgi:hypothetical protein
VGIVVSDEGAAGSVELAILGDPGPTERQKQTLLDVYSAFLAQNTSTSPTGSRRQPRRPGVAGATPLKEIDMAKAFDIKNIDLKGIDFTAPLTHPVLAARS